MKATEADKEALKILQKHNPIGEFSAISVIGWGIRRSTYRLDRLSKMGLIKKRCVVSEYNPGFLPVVSVSYSLINKPAVRRTNQINDGLHRQRN